MRKTQNILIACLMACFLFSCNQTKKETVEEHLYTNELVNETSPYLLQHAHNPVDWKPWGPKVLEEAKNAKKLMIVSIGYAACHWCHVMERESFEDSTVAAIMNTHYLSVKVDREERPDVDQIYINAVQLMNGNAGWPLNVITLPDGRPVFGGTYFKKEDWIQVLQQLQELYESEPDKLIQYADRLEEGIKSLDLVEINTSEVDFSKFALQPTLEKWKQSLDTIDGGDRGAPKFMMPNKLAYFLRAGIEHEDGILINHVKRSLQKMAYGGIYDHIGGGFARYSTDDRWHVPHFEKMLYDNAQLVSLYSNAYKAFQDSLYKEVVEETLGYIQREMTDETGAFYSSLDADSETSEGELEEGAFYTFTKEELQEVIPSSDWEMFQAYFNINEKGFWKEENKYVLFRSLSNSELSQAFSIEERLLENKVSDWKKSVFEYREKRPKTRLDDKTLTSWNALMILGYVDAYKAFGNEAYLEIALKNASFISRQQLMKDGSLWHSYKDGKSSIPGYLEDYAQLTQAFIALHEVTLDQKWIELSNLMTQYVFDHFFDEGSHMFYFTSAKEKEIITRNFEYRDNVIPASNSVMAKNLFILSHHYDSELYRQTAQQMLKNILPEMAQYPNSFSNWLDLLQNYRFKFYEVVVVGENAPKKVAEINRNYLPHILISGSPKVPVKMPLLEERYVDGKTVIYVCENYTCKLPVQESEKALELLR